MPDDDWVNGPPFSEASSVGTRFMPATETITPRPARQAIAYAAALLVVAVCMSLAGVIIAFAAHIARHLYYS